MELLPFLPFSELPAPAAGSPGEPAPAGLTSLFGPPGILRLYPWLVAPALLGGAPVLVADGGNAFDPRDFGRLAEWAGRPPAELLRRVHVARAFTCHQVGALVRQLPAFARPRGIRIVLLPGLTETFYDESIPAREARGAWHATLARLGRLAREGMGLLAVCPDHPMEPRRRLRPALAGAAGRVVVCREEAGGRLRLERVKPPGGALAELPLPEALLGRG